MEKEKIDKLPKWAREYIRVLKRQKDTVVRELNEYIDNQTESPYYTEDLVCSGEEVGPSYKKRYIQAYRLNVKHDGVNLQILLSEGHIDLRWSSDNDMDDVALIPSTHQAVRLVSQEHMYKIK